MTHYTLIRGFIITFMKAWPSPRQMKVRGVGRELSLARQDAVNPAPKFHSLLAMIDYIDNLGAG